MSFRFSFLCWQGTWRAQLFVSSGVVHSTLKGSFLHDGGIKKGKKIMSQCKGKNNLRPASTGFKIILSAGMKFKFGTLESLFGFGGGQRGRENRDIDIQFELKNST